ncbi:hypothetical protein BJ322DRAFT_1197273 [Thelephora terrestris]|uniref:F-box domain-containing protein n=1 Tax=Thelephora terrestris TaxID=56493 RepID=A0A9P6HF10_9AGAM|nr:hypothetical protein BJ322DRAFT_1197273 [Thelephora terrestris]
MDSHTYPGRGLSVSQLIFALNEELKRVAYSPPFTLEAVSQLNRDASLALATIREWRNSFACVNRIPMDVLTLIPAHFISQRDRFRVASVCRHWRGVFLMHGALWSQIFLRMGEECVSILLERAKGSPLDIIVHRHDPIGTIALISPRAQQIRSLEFRNRNWLDIIAVSEFNSGQLPLLRTLKINCLRTFDWYSPTVVTPPSPTSFRGFANLEEFVFTSGTLSLLGHLVFPKLTTFELCSTPDSECNALHLLEFLKASPLLNTVKLKISAAVVLRGVPQEMVVLLPNVETFSLHLAEDPTSEVYNIAAHISCPFSRDTSLMHNMDDGNVADSLGVFPAPILWDTIIHRYMASPIEEVTLEIKGLEEEEIESLLTFQSSDATIFRLGFNVDRTDVDEDELDMSLVEMGWKIFSQALITIRDHPLLSNVKRLHIKYKAAVPNAYLTDVAHGIRELFESLGPLDELTIRGCDLRVFLPHFLDSSWPDELEKPIVFLRTKELTILHLSMEVDEMECASAILKLAKSQHALAIPFERVTVHMEWIPGEIEEELRRWVGAVDFHEDEYMEYMES